MVQFHQSTIEINEKQFDLPYSILDAEEMGEFVYVIYDYMEFNKNSVANNLVCINQLGEVVWVAENPTNQSNDAYTNFMRIKLKGSEYIAVNNFVGVSCLIECSTGKCLKTEFTK